MDFNRAVDLFERLFKIINFAAYDDSKRTIVSTELALTAINLLDSIHLLCGEKHFNGAGIILRSQYETFVRSVWSYHSATDAQVEKLSATLTKDSLLASKNIPGLAQMLADLEKCPNVKNLMRALNEFRETSWLALNSLVHGGVFAMHGAVNEPPPERIETVFRTANGIALLAIIQLGMLTGRPAIQQQIYAATAGYEDCLPPRN
ncbi:DUF6988 family protein [Pseudidiomarina salilacus]|uniref:DUF6988 family protein n=1 Tax=Pseudidiomarina salilacus TaxID=3384452 RepID=UPI003985666E